MYNFFFFSFLDIAEHAYENIKARNLLTQKGKTSEILMVTILMRDMIDISRHKGSYSDDDSYLLRIFGLSFPKTPQVE